MSASSATGLLDTLPLVRARDMERPESLNGWSYGSLKGRVCELRGSDASATLSAVACILADAQRHGRSCAWVQARDDEVYVPDLLSWSVDLSRIPFVRVHQASQLAPVLDRLVSSSAFGLVVLDLDASMPWSSAVQMRLVRLVQHHDIAVLCVRDNAGASLVDMRVRAELGAAGPDRLLRIIIEKDKRQSDIRQHEEACYGAAWMP